MVSTFHLSRTQPQQAHYYEKGISQDSIHLQSLVSRERDGKLGFQLLGKAVSQKCFMLQKFCLWSHPNGAVGANAAHGDFLQYLSAHDSLPLS